MIWLLLLTLVGISLVCAFYGAKLLVWTGAMTAGLVIFGASS